jgi:beta-phosphoglucomutase
MTDHSTKAFIFDMDGTLVDNMHVHVDAWRRLLEENGLEMVEHNFLVKTAGKTNREIMPAVFGDISDERISELASRKESLYREAYLPIRKPVDGLIDFLNASQHLGIKMAVATAASDPNMEFILDGLNLRRFFGAVTTASDVKLGKPNPDMFLVSAEKLGVDAKDCIVFEDAIGGFEAAHRAKMVSIGITTVNSAEDVLKCDSVVEAHADFTRLDPAALIERYLS